MQRRWKGMLAAACLIALAPVNTSAQPPARSDDESEALAKKLSNPISDLVSVPFQFNWEQEFGPLELSQFILNIQPVIPFTLNEDWNLIVRIITPVVGQPPFVRGGPGVFGIADLTTSFFSRPPRPAASRSDSGRRSAFPPLTNRRSDRAVGARGRRSSRWNNRDHGPTACSGTSSGRSPAIRAARR